MRARRPVMLFAAANVDLNVRVLAKGERPLYATVVSGEGENRPIQLASGANAKIALERALNDAPSDLFADPAFVNAIISAGQPATDRVGG